ncbi:MAG: LptF/LptG family permease [Armatimonadetes bacterium]|nr:LptF/LptG family permease [Armatimonadota bacterium]
MKRADRYLLLQLPLPFFVGLAVFIVIMLAEVAWRISGVLVGTTVSGLMLLQFFLYSTPRAAVWSTPVGLLVAVCLALVSMERHGEIIALRVGGWPVRRVFVPWLFAAALISALAMWANQCVVPRTTSHAYELFRRITLQAPVVKEAWDELFRDPDGNLYFVHHMKPTDGELEGITIWRVDPSGRVRRLIVAASAAVQGNSWVLRDGYWRDLDAFGQPSGGPLKFKQLRVDLWTAIHQYYADRRTPYEMSITELSGLARALEAGGKDAHQLLVHLHFAYSIPAAGFVFVLIAAPLAHRYARLGPFAGLVLAIVILFLYNGVRSWALALGLAGAVPPALAGWSANVLFGAVGLWLTLRE